MSKETLPAANSTKSYQKTLTHFWHSVPKRGAIFQNSSSQNSNHICAVESEHGFGRVQCGSCQHETIVPLRDGARRMAEAAIHLVDDLLPLVPVRQFVVTFPVQLRLWMSRSKSLCANACEKVCAELTVHLQSAAGIEKGLSGLVVFIQRFGSAANLNIHFRVITLDGVYEKKTTGRLKFYAAQAAAVTHRITFGPNAGQPVGRLKTQTSLWRSEQNFKSNSTDCVSAGGYSVSRKRIACRNRHQGT